jgi:hypothetical protein
MNTSVYHNTFFTYLAYYNSLSPCPLRRGKQRRVGEETRERRLDWQWRRTRERYSCRETMFARSSMALYEIRALVWQERSNN